MKRKTLTICIPAYNEEANILLLLKDLLKQKYQTVSLRRILIASDGSTDKTVVLAKSLSIKKIRVIVGMSRKGVAYRQNQLFSKVSTDICILLNADVRVTDSLFVDKLVKPIVLGKAQLTSPDIKDLPSRTFFEYMLSISMRLKTILFLSWKEANNVCTCHGQARAFDRRLYQLIRFPQDSGEDIYSYLFAVLHGFTFRYVRNTFVLYRLPSSFKDHLKQSIRYIGAKRDFLENFHHRFVEEEIKIPFSTYFQAARKSFSFIVFYSPMLIVYMITLSVVYIAYVFQKNKMETWNVTSTKSLQIEI